MTATLYEARLRGLAEAATPGPWWDQSHRTPQAKVFNVGSDVGKLIARVHEGSPKRAEANAAFIAAANPATILALLDALSAERERGDRAEGLVYRVATDAFGCNEDSCLVDHKIIAEARAFLATQKAEGAE